MYVKYEVKYKKCARSNFFIFFYVIKETHFLRATWFITLGYRKTPYICPNLNLYFRLWEKPKNSDIRLNLNMIIGKNISV